METGSDWTLKKELVSLSSHLICSDGEFDFEIQTKGLTYKTEFTRLCTRLREPLIHCCSLIICFILLVMLEVSKSIID